MIFFHFGLAATGPAQPISIWADDLAVGMKVSASVFIGQQKRFASLQSLVQYPSLRSNKTASDLMIQLAITAVKKPVKLTMIHPEESKSVRQDAFIRHKSC